VSGFRAVAGVSATFRSLLRDRMEQPVDVTVAPPDIRVVGSTGRRVNLYLYRVTENGYLKNQEIPGQGHPADYGSPPLSLDLSYLLTAFGSSEDGADADLEAQQILGDAMHVVHRFPVVSDTLHQNDNPADPLILDPTLVGAFEQVKITLQPASLDDLSKIWSALPQANFRRSVMYHVAVVQIDSRRPRRPALPVRERRVYAVPLQTPYITEIVRDPSFDNVRTAIAEVGDPILILGRNLRGASTRVLLGVPPPVAVADAQDQRIRLIVPPTVPAGLHAVQVIHDLLLQGAAGQPPVPHRGAQSNAVPLLVLPQFDGIAPPTAGAGALVTVTVTPPALARQTKLLLVGDFEVAAEPVPVDGPPSSTIDFRLPTGAARIPPASYLVRVRVDGAESRLTVNPATSQYDGPLLTVT
jgi:hypothetical protein